MPAKLNFFKTPASEVGPCPLPLEYQAASSQARLKSARAQPPWSPHPLSAYAHVFTSLREPSLPHELPHPFKELQHAPNRIVTFPIRLLVLYLNHRNPPPTILKVLSLSNGAVLVRVWLAAQQQPRGLVPLHHARQLQAYDVIGSSSVVR
jgi:hypothetical protein